MIYLMYWIYLMSFMYVIHPMCWNYLVDLTAQQRQNQDQFWPWPWTWSWPRSAFRAGALRAGLYSIFAATLPPPVVDWLAQTLKTISNNQKHLTSMQKQRCRRKYDQCRGNLHLYDLFDGLDLVDELHPMSSTWCAVTTWSLWSHSTDRSRTSWGYSNRVVDLLMHMSSAWI